MKFLLVAQRKLYIKFLPDSAAQRQKDSIEISKSLKKYNSTDKRYRRKKLSPKASKYCKASLNNTSSLMTSCSTLIRCSNSKKSRKKITSSLKDIFVKIQKNLLNKILDSMKSIIQVSEILYYLSWSKNNLLGVIFLALIRSDRCLEFRARLIEKSPELMPKKDLYKLPVNSK